MVRPPQLSKHQAAYKEDSSFLPTPFQPDIVWRQNPPLPPPPSRVQTLEKESNNDETYNKSWALRNLKQDMEEMRAENARMAHLVNELRLSLRKQVRITLSTEMRAMNCERELRLLRINCNSVETHCEMRTLLDPVLETPPDNLEGATDFSRQRNEDGVITMEQEREWVNTRNTNGGLSERLIARKELSSRMEKEQSNLEVIRHMSRVPESEEGCVTAYAKVAMVVSEGMTSRNRRETGGSTVMGTVSIAAKKKTRRPVKKCKDAKKKLEGYKLEDQVTKEIGLLPLWLRERLEEGKVKTLKDNDCDGQSVTLENDIVNESEVPTKGEELLNRSSDRGENKKMDRREETQRRRPSNMTATTVSAAVVKEGTRDISSENCNVMNMDKKEKEVGKEKNQKATTFTRSSYLSTKEEERANDGRKILQQSSSSENKELWDITRQFVKLQVKAPEKQYHMIQEKDTLDERTALQRSNDMVSGSSSTRSVTIRTTTEGGGARGSLKRNDNKENIAELLKTGREKQGGKQDEVVQNADVHHHENEEENQLLVPRRAVRKGRVLSYKEPSIMSKIRRHTGHSPSNIFPRTDG